MSITQNNIAIIPARGGSKRLPRKNIKDFFGKPIMAYSIESAIESELFSEVMVSTENHEIADIAVKYGARVPFYRSRKNADDHATTIDVILEVLKDYREKEGKNFKYGCCIYATAPFVRSKHLVEGFQLLREKNFTTVFPVLPFSSPVWRGLERSEDGLLKMIWPEYSKTRTQDLKTVYHDAGQWYWFDTGKIFHQNGLHTSNSGSVLLDSTEAQDIDSKEDWELAKIKFKRFRDKYGKV